MDGGPDYGISTRYADYVAILKSIWPLAFMGALAGFSRSMKVIFREDTPLHIFMAFCITTIPSAVTGVVAVFLIPYFCDPKSITAELQLGIAAVAGGVGTRTFDHIIRRLFHLAVTEKGDHRE